MAVTNETVYRVLAYERPAWTSELAKMSVAELEEFRSCIWKLRHEFVMSSIRTWKELAHNRVILQELGPLESAVYRVWCDARIEAATTAAKEAV